MNRCPITYEPCGNESYSRTGLKLLSPTFRELDPFPYSVAEQIEEARQRAAKMSIQGVQPKLSAVLDAKSRAFRIVTTNGAFIIKPPNMTYPELPENEDLTMRLAALCGIEIPLHGLLRCRNGSLSYFIKRFDRKGRGTKLAVEDFAQLAGRSRDTKYDFSMEKVVALVDRFCTFPVIEKKKLFALVVYAFLTGNENLHLKNFSLIRRANRYELSPAYDLVNTTIALKNVREEMALPLGGKRSGITRKLLVDYFARERMGLNADTVRSVMDRVQSSLQTFPDMIRASFLSDGMKEKYLALCNERALRLWSGSVINFR